MGAQESHLGAGLNPKNLKAYHVLRVAESSPAAEAGIEPFFDYIVGIGGQQVVSVPHSYFLIKRKTPTSASL